MRWMMKMMIIIGFSKVIFKEKASENLITEYNNMILTLSILDYYRSLIDFWST